MQYGVVLFRLAMLLVLAATMFCPRPNRRMLCREAFPVCAMPSFAFTLCRACATPYNIAVPASTPSTGKFTKCDGWLPFLNVEVKLSGLSRYGGRKIEAASNIVFSNGLLDPWHGTGVLQNVSDSVIAIIIPEGAHHLDVGLLLASCGLH